jgi:hypothetical protein
MHQVPIEGGDTIIIWLTFIPLLCIIINSFCKDQSFELECL